MSDLIVKPAEQLYINDGPLKKVVHRYSTKWVPADQVVCMTPTASASNDEWSTVGDFELAEQESFAGVPSIVETMKTMKTENMKTEKMRLSLSTD